jgi:hypothetical protein
LDQFAVFVEGVSEGEPTSYDPSAPLLHFRRRNNTADDPEGTWSLYLDQLSENPVERTLFHGTADKDDVARAVRLARAHLEQIDSDKNKITVEIGERGITVGFEGRWLVEPDPDATTGTRTRMEGYDAGAYYGVALTKRGRIAAYVAHCNDGSPPELKDYDDLDDAAEIVPEDILAEAAGAMGQERVVWRDI